MMRAVVGVVVVLMIGLVVGSAVPFSPSEDASNATHPTKVDNCRTITKPGKYVLSKDIKNGGGGDNFTFASQSCIVIKSDDVVFDGRGGRIDGLGVSDTTGIAVIGNNGSIENVTVTNVTMTDWNRGIYYRNAERGTIKNATLSHNAYGISIEKSTGTRVTGVEADHNLAGVYVGPSATGTWFANDSYEDNHIGGVLSNSSAINHSGNSSAVNRSGNSTNASSSSALRRPG